MTEPLTDDRRAVDEFLSRYPKPVKLFAGTYPNLSRVANRVLGQDEVESICHLALMRAAHRFDPSRGFDLSTPAGHHMKGAVLKELWKRLGRRSTFSLDGPDGHSYDPPARHGGPVETAEAVELMARLNALPPADRAVVRMRLGWDADPMTFEQIAEALGSPSAVDAERAYNAALARCRGDDAEPLTDDSPDLAVFRSDDPSGYHGVYPYVGGWWEAKAFKRHVGPRSRTPREAAKHLVRFWKDTFGERWKDYFASRHARGWVGTPVGGGWMARVHVARPAGETVLIVGVGADGKPATAHDTPGVRPVARRDQLPPLVKAWGEARFGPNAGWYIRRCWASMSNDAGSPE